MQQIYNYNIMVNSWIYIYACIYVYVTSRQNVFMFFLQICLDTFETFKGFVFCKVWLHITHTVHTLIICSQHAIFTICRLIDWVVFCILFSTLTIKHRVYVNGHQNNPQTRRSLPCQDSAPSEIPGSATALIQE